MKTNVLGLLSGVALATSGIVLSSSYPASAAVLWDWSFSSGVGSSGSGTFTTTDVRPDGSYLIEDITGNIVVQNNTSGPIAALIPPGGFQGNDNLLFATFPQFNVQSGVSFTFLDQSFIPPLSFSGSLYYDDGSFRPAGYYLLTTFGVDPIQFSATAQVTPPTGVPESSNLLGLIALGGLMLGSAVRKAKQ